MFNSKRNRQHLPQTALPPVSVTPSHKFILDVPLLRLSRNDVWTLRDACQGTQIFGGVGSGKSSTVARDIAHAFLRQGMGGLVLCAKPGERALWERYARETGRSKSLIIFDDTGRNTFNFLDYEMRRGERLVVHNLVTTFMRLMDAVKPREESGSNEVFWRDSCADLLRNTLTALYAAYGTVQLSDMTRLIASAPKSLEEVGQKAWRDRSFCYRTLMLANRQPRMPLPPEDRRQIEEFFFEIWPTYSDKMRSSIEATFRASASPFLTGYLRELFCTTTTAIPELTHESAIIIVDLPIKEHDTSGMLAQHIWKYLWQRATERRKVDGDKTRPTYLFADECQFFVSKYDLEFQSTARSARACTVYISQNLPTYYERMDGKNPEHTANALLGNFQTKVFLQNLDETTNRYAAETIGKVMMTFRSYGTNNGRSVGENIGYSESSGSNQSSGPNGAVSGGSNWNSSFNEGRNKGKTWGSNESFNQQVEYEVLPSTFTSLKQARNGLPAEGIVLMAGQRFKATGRHWIKAEFSQVTR